MARKPAWQKSGFIVEYSFRRGGFGFSESSRSEAWHDAQFNLETGGDLDALTNADETARVGEWYSSLVGCVTDLDFFGESPATRRLAAESNQMPIRFSVSSEAVQPMTTTVVEEQVCVRISKQRASEILATYPGTLNESVSNIINAGLRKGLGLSHDSAFVDCWQTEQGGGSD